MTRPGLRLLCLGGCLLLLSACKTTAASRAGLPEEVFTPLALLPGDAPLYLRVSPEGVKDLRAVLDEDETSLEGLDSASGAALERLLDLLVEDPAKTGLDPLRPLFVALLAVDGSGATAAAQYGVPVDPSTLPVGFHSAAVFPAEDVAKLAQTLERMWSEQPPSKQTLMRVTPLEGWVRLDVFAFVASVDPQAAQAGFEAALAAAPKRRIDRITPALAAFLMEKADAAGYVQLSKLREFIAGFESISTRLVLANVPPETRDQLRLRSAHKLATTWRLFDGRIAELEDLAFRLDATPERAIQLRAEGTLTKLGRTIMAARGVDQRLPAFTTPDYLVDLQLAGDFDQMIRQAPLPVFARSEELREELTSDAFEVAGPVGQLAFIAAPFSYLHAFFGERTKKEGLRSADAIHVRVLGRDGERREGQQALPRLLGLFRFASEAAAQKAQSSVRARMPEMAAALLQIQRLAGAKDPSPVLAASFNADPAALVNQAQLEPIPSGLHVSVSPGIRRSLERFKINAPSDLWALIEHGPLEVHLSPGDEMLELRAQIGAAVPAPQLPRVSYEPVDLTPSPQAQCRDEVGLKVSAVALDVARGGGLRHFEEVRKTPCLAQHPRLMEELQTVKVQLEKFDPASK